jgi:hypothetical protein
MDGVVGVDDDGGRLGRDTGSSSEGFPSARLVGALVFLLLLGLIGVGFFVRLRRGNT